MQFKADNSREKEVIREGLFLLGGGRGVVGPGLFRDDFRSLIAEILYRRTRC